MDIQTYSTDKAREVAELFHQSVHAIDSSLYTSEQKEAWAPTPVDYESWSERLKVKQPFIALIENCVAGFIELDIDGHIDCTYTLPNFQRRGVASALYEHLLMEARARNLKRLYVEASIIAKPFFEHRGFYMVKKNEVQRNGVSLVNFLMEMYLSTNNQMQPPLMHRLIRALAIKESIVQFNIDIDSKHKELFLQARAFLLTFNLVETKKERITTYSDQNGGICHIRTMSHGIDIGFLKGARMEDQFDALTGTGKVMRVLPLTSMNKEKIEYYLNQALAINEK